MASIQCCSASADQTKLAIVPETPSTSALVPEKSDEASELSESTAIPTDRRRRPRNGPAGDDSSGAADATPEPSLKRDSSLSFFPKRRSSRRISKDASEGFEESDKASELWEPTASPVDRRRRPSDGPAGDDSSGAADTTPKPASLKRESSPSFRSKGRSSCRDVSEGFEDRVQNVWASHASELRKTRLATSNQITLKEDRFLINPRNSWWMPYVRPPR